MGRAKVKLEFIKNQKNRTKTFKSRTKILTKKAYELKTLCDVDVCMIIHGSCIEDHPMIVWPQDRDTIRPLVESYNKQSTEDRGSRTYDVFRFLSERNKKVEGDLAKLQEDNFKLRVPNWNERYERCSEAELKEIVDTLESKLRLAKNRVEEIKGYGVACVRDGVASVHRGSVAGQGYNLDSLSLRQRNMQLEVHNQAQFMNSQDMFSIPCIDQHQQLPNKQQLDQTDYRFVNPMLMMSNNNYSQLGPDHNINIYNNNNYHPVYFNNHLSGMTEYSNNSFSQRSPMGYHIPPYLPYPVMEGSSLSSQMSAIQMGMCYDLSTVHMGDKKAHLS